MVAHAQAAAQDLLGSTKIKDSVGAKGNQQLIEKLCERMKYVGIAVIDVSFITVNNGPFKAAEEKK
jgi:hypothetical protein